MVTDTLQWINQDMTITLSNKEILYSSLNMETSLLGFRLDNLFRPLIAFALQYTDSTDYGIIPFNRVLVTEGISWDASLSSLIIPLNGNYFISFATTSMIHLMVNDAKRAIACMCDTNSDGTSAHNGIQVGRGSVMLSLTVGDEVKFMSGIVTESNSDGLVSAQGFLYRPLSDISVAWCVAKSNDVVLTESIYFTGMRDILSYDLVLVDVNSPWNKEANKVVIQSDGTYFIDLYGTLCGSGYCGDGNSGVHCHNSHNFSFNFFERL